VVVVHGGPVGKRDGGEPVEAHVGSLGVLVGPPELDRPAGRRQGS
jgi:hypothetical protein